ncbi:hypothetical protein SAMN06297251_10481 [Fulvimarina manganoxydans]|uniref:Uncharacterized protein n=1 Tax=Fulvimarina manganoxydans TaxID=937218 RepID=A0A1W2ADI7_9HYPH|nr:hypothetical protein [Fulvimarina manganoxydans]SMC58552.1 hypothetical protein SAMN06297251_10481 [Fulvimarina manganoxydans]
MESRSATNILLAIIAATLLFGAAQVTSALSIVFIVGAVLLVGGAIIYFGLSWVTAWLETIGTEWGKLQDGDASIETRWTVTVFAMMPIAVVVGIGAAWMWLGGDPDPLWAFFGTFPGALCGLAGGVILAWFSIHVASAGLSWMSENYGTIPGRAWSFAAYLLAALFAVVALPRLAWRRSRKAGDGTVGTVVSTLFAAVFGLLISIMTVGIGIALFAGIADSLGYHV